MWDRLLKDYDQVIFIPMSSGLSNTCQTAVMLSDDDAYRGKVYVVDNHRISVPQLQSVYDAGALAEEGKTAAEIKAKRAREIAQTAEDNGEILTEKPVNMALKEFQAHKFNIIEPDINE